MGDSTEECSPAAKRRRVPSQARTDASPVKTESLPVEIGTSLDGTTDDKNFGQSSVVDSSNTSRITVNQSAVINNKNVATASSAMENSIKITDLNEKCFIEMMKWLEFPDLLNIANSTRKLCAGACVVYSERYANKFVKYNGDAINTKGLEIDVSNIIFKFTVRLKLVFPSLAIAENIHSINFLVLPIAYNHFVI